MPKVSRVINPGITHTRNQKRRSWEFGFVFSHRVSHRVSHARRHTSATTSHLVGGSILSMMLSRRLPGGMGRADRA